MQLKKRLCSESGPKGVAIAVDWAREKAGSASRIDYWPRWAAVLLDDLTERDAP
jgi:hypothetical protein